MKRYTIGLTLLFALMNTGCEDAKAESKDYDVEIAELQQQVSQLNSRLDSLINVVPTNTNIAQLSSRLDSTISVIPKKYNYEGVFIEKEKLIILEKDQVIKFCNKNSLFISCVKKI